MGETVAVLDYGGRWMKAGWAFNFPTDEEPRVVTPSAVHVNQNAAAGAGEQGELHRPIRGGKIVSWDQFEALSYYVLYDLLGWELGNEGNIMLCEPLLTSRPDRETMAQLMFEVFNVTGLFVQDQAVLSLYAVGRTNGLVVDVGHDKIDVGTVTEGVLNTTSVRRLPYGGKHLTQHLQRMLLQQDAAAAGGGSAQRPPLSEEAAEALKDLCARCAESEAEFASAIAADSSAAAPPPETFRLPDGQEFTISAADRLRLGEALFSPSALLLHPASANPAEAACDSAACLTDPLMRKLMYENLLLVGGGSVLPGASSRFLSEMKSMLAPNANATLCAVPEYMPTPSVPRDASWMGGAVLAKVAMIQGHFIVKADYDEAGPVSVHRRCG
ncbi:Actin-related protein 7 [Tetrabaena socialis]|uniref:Actin-related protein 7 n=1 Tax=Tetrabaena socialis TaxID=47790 RepID=A0A2J8AGZ5_9CHLO|nr:Actin-related protein 7 [Tetrabaena socialis]|eukprot:PNH11787.1 Actin-related protein 7 [Tetrabaena socialis]